MWVRFPPSPPHLLMAEEEQKFSLVEGDRYEDIAEQFGFGDGNDRHTKRGGARKPSAFAGKIIRKEETRLSKEKRRKELEKILGSQIEKSPLLAEPVNPEGALEIYTLWILSSIQHNKVEPVDLDFDSDNISYQQRKSARGPGGQNMQKGTRGILVIHRYTGIRAIGDERTLEHSKRSAYVALVAKVIAHLEDWRNYLNSFEADQDKEHIVKNLARQNIENALRENS